jgi:putative FmdB family regulatory protein
MNYEYFCDTCQHIFVATKSIADRDTSVLCESCKTDVPRKRLISVPAALITDRRADKAENKNPYGLGEVERVAQQREWDKKYEKRWEHISDTPKKQVSIGDMLKEHGGISG